MGAFRRHAVLAVLLAAILLIAATGLLLFAQSKGRVAPLLTGPEQFTADDFHIYRPDDKVTFLPKTVLDAISVKENIRRTKDGFPSAAGRLETVSFMPPRFLGVPVKGADTDQGNLYKTKSLVALECIGTSGTIDLLRGQSEAWFLAAVRIPDGWCKGQVRVIAEAKLDSLHVGLGTPLRISAFQWLMGEWLGPVVAAMFVFAIGLLIAVPFVALPTLGLGVRLTMVAAYPTLFGYATFMAAWYSSANPLVLKAMAIAFFSFPALMFWVRSRLDVAADCQGEDVGRFITGLAAMVVLLLVPYYLLATGGGYWFSAYAFYPASWSTDNILSLQTARSIIHAGAVHPEPLGVWSIADRGVVQPGTLFALFGMPGIGQRLLDWPVGIYVQALFTSVIQGMVVPMALVFLARNLKAAVHPLLIGLMLLCTPFVMINTVYAWPKLSGGLLALMSLLWLNFSMQTGNAKALCLAVFLFFLGAMNHSASLLMIGAIVFYVVFSLMSGYRRWSHVSKVLLGAPAWMLLTVVASLFLLRWVEMVEPKSSFAATFLLTGNGRFGLSQAEVWQAVRLHYSAMTVESFLQDKASGAGDLVWTTRDFFARDGGSSWSLAAIRAQQFFSMLPAMGPGMLLAVAICGIRRLSRRGSADVRADRGLYIVGMSCVASLLTIVLICGMPMVAHHLPYGIILCFLLVVLHWCRGDRLALTLGGAVQLVNLLVVWYFGAVLMWDRITSGYFHGRAW
jgi:hypothetical protein